PNLPWITLGFDLIKQNDSIEAAFFHYRFDIGFKWIENACFFNRSLVFRRLTLFQPLTNRFFDPSLMNQQFV
ncbi:hypothetical protein, partial [Brevibacillus sp. LEMMJ03]|uniref:hypothetical protein n=1 Tax=Brevibacillus sp. LEMMJ03 TaxID=2595056 RepID=UPI001C8F9CB3